MTPRAEKSINAQERDLLAAILAVVDLPHPASYEDRQGYYDDLSARTARLCGALEGALADPGHYLASVTETCRHFAAEPLGYEAKLPDGPAPRLAELAGPAQAAEDQGVTTEPEAGQ